MRRLTIACMLLALAGHGAAAAEPAAAVEMRLLAANLTPYVGEEVLVTLEIRTRQQPARPLRPFWPELAAATVEDLPFPPPQRGIDATGPFLLQQVRCALVPLHSGPLVLSGAGVESDAGRQEAAPLRLRVRSLPVRGRPDGFAGGVAHAELDLAAGGRGTREVVLTLRGHGALQRLPAPVPRLGAEEQLVLLAEERSGTAEGERQRSWRYLYLPGEERAGHLTFSLPLFDPQEGRYRTLRAGVQQASWFGVAAAVAAGSGAALLCWRYRRRRRMLTLEALLALRLGESANGLSRRQIRARLGGAGLSPALLTQLDTLWDAEDRRFAPGAPTAADLTQSRQRLARALRRARRKSIDKRRRIL